MGLDQSGTESSFEGLGGLKIFTRMWKPDGPARAVVVISHGLNSHSGQYLWAGSQFASNGFATYALDHRGRGRSEGERFFIQNVSEYVTDLATFIEIAKSENPGLPVFLLGHSMGGVVSCVYCLEHQDRIQGLICESFAYRVPAPDAALAMLKGLSHVAPHAHVLSLDMKDFTRDPAALALLEADELTLKESQPSSTVAALVRADERLGKEFGNINLPVFIIHGTADKATRPEGSQEFYDRAGSSDKTLKFYEGHYHDLLNDFDKDVVMADIVDWIKKRVA
ncbi:MAG: lysophospholipase [Fimbriimonadaceae bacterium]|nr:lysophospholipase [Fimbriimonadaceae bacterium]QYK58497.1 MAG: lysophospholipase [Fimbriimonadaceae bacterium]